MIYELKKVDLWSVIKISFLIHLVIGIAVGLLMSVFFAFIFSLPGAMDPYDSFGGSSFNPAAFGIFGGLLMGLFYAFIIVIINGVIAPLIVVVIYNLFAGWLGGIKLHLNEVNKTVVNQIAAAQPSIQPDNSTGGNT